MCTCTTTNIHQKHTWSKISFYFVIAQSAELLEASEQMSVTAVVKGSSTFQPELKAFSQTVQFIHTRAPTMWHFFCLSGHNRCSAGFRFSPRHHFLSKCRVYACYHHPDERSTSVAWTVLGGFTLHSFIIHLCIHEFMIPTIKTSSPTPASISMLYCFLYLMYSSAGFLHTNTPAVSPM